MIQGKKDNCSNCKCKYCTNFECRMKQDFVMACLKCTGAVLSCPKHKPLIYGRPGLETEGETE